MGSCVTKPGCPPCNRFRSFWPEWDGDLCNLGYGVYKQNYVNGTFVPDAGTEPVKLTELVDDAINDAEDLAENTMKNVGDEVGGWLKELEDFETIIIRTAEIMGWIIAALVLLFWVCWLFNSCRTCASCIKCGRGGKKEKTAIVSAV